MGVAISIEGATDAELFEAYVERFLAPSLSPGRVVVMDNLGAHKTERVKELIEGRGCELRFLPAYSPDLNPIEEAFSKVKNLLRKAEARTLAALFEVTAGALEAVIAGDARGYLLRALRLRDTIGSLIMITALDDLGVHVLGQKQSRAGVPREVKGEACQPRPR